MTSPAKTQLEPGRAYRTRELRKWSANPTRLAARLVRDGKLRRAAQGLFYAPAKGRFGEAPPSTGELLRAFLEGSPFVISGPPRWNALGLGSTAMFGSTLVYNTKRSGEFIMDGRTFLLRRVAFPEHVSPEYFIVDLLEHHGMAGVSLETLEAGLVSTLRTGRWDVERLVRLADRFGTKATLALVQSAILESQR